ncbi:hypothetical protein J6590_016086 [Homalodisca vitripennis]|nr:hypothetical protein J6590_016086 [Homalodisca vitripennis]
MTHNVSVHICVHIADAVSRHDVIVKAHSGAMTRLRTYPVSVGNGGRCSVFRGESLVTPRLGHECQESSRATGDGVITGMSSVVQPSPVAAEWLTRRYRPFTTSDVTITTSSVVRHFHPLLQLVA